MKKICLIAFLVLCGMFPVKTFALKWMVASTYDSGTLGFGASSTGSSTVTCPSNMYVQSAARFQKLFAGFIMPFNNGIVLRCVGLDGSGLLDFSNVVYKTWPDGENHIGEGMTWQDWLEDHDANDMNDVFVSSNSSPQTTFMHGMIVSGPGRNKPIHGVKLRMRRFEPYDASAARVVLANSPVWTTHAVNIEGDDNFYESADTDSVSCLPSGQNYNPNTNKIHVVRGIKIWHQVNPGTTPQTRHIREIKLRCAELKRVK